MATSRRTQADRRDAARAAVISAAVGMLSESGFAQSTTAAIAAKAGVTTGALHHHFSTKESLFIAVLDDVTTRILDQFRKLSDEPVDGRDSGGTAPASQLIESLWSVYGSKQYWAVWEINMGFRSNREIYLELLAHRQQTAQRMYEAVVENGALRDATKQTLLRLMPFILSTIRGIFLETFMQRDEVFLKKQLSFLSEVFQRELDQASRAEPKAAAGKPGATSRPKPAPKSAPKPKPRAKVPAV